MDDTDSVRVKQEPMDAPRARVKLEPRTPEENPEVIPVSSDDDEAEDVSRGAIAKRKGRKPRHSSSDSTESYEWDPNLERRKKSPKTSRNKKK